MTNLARVRPSLRRLLPFLLIVVMTGWGAAYLLHHPTEWAAIRDIAPLWLFLLFALATAKIIHLGLFTKVVVASLGIKLSVKEWVGLAAMSTLGNYLTPFRGGAAIRAVYLKSRHGMPYPCFLSTLTVLYVMNLSTSAALGLLALIVLYVWLGTAESGLFLVFLAILSLPLPVFAITRGMPVQEKSLGETRPIWNPIVAQDAGLLFRARRFCVETVTSMIEGWTIISTRASTVGQLILLSISNAIVTLFMIHSSFIAFGVSLPLPQSLVISSLFMTISLIPLTPSGLGIAEMTMVLVSQGFGVDGTLGVLSAGLNRSIMIFASLLWGLLFSIILRHRLIPSESPGQERR